MNNINFSTYSFPHVLSLLINDGAKISRVSWSLNPYLEFVILNQNNSKYDMIYKVYKEDSYHMEIPWSPKVEDILANDWYILPK